MSARLVYGHFRTRRNRLPAKLFASACVGVLLPRRKDDALRLRSRSKSALGAYGVNKAAWSFIPGGVISGTALIQPDLPELKTWPYLWQQYVMGGAATNYMFLVLAVDRLATAPE